MYQPTWIDTKIIANHQPSTATNSSAINRPITDIPAIKQWSAIKLFYRQHMPYARLAQKESVAVIHHLSSSTIDGTDDIDEVDISQQKIIAAIRVKPIGQYQLINGLLVHPDYRGQQLSSQLLKFIAPQLTTKNCFLFAHPWLIGLYQQHHFIVIDQNVVIGQNGLSAIPAEITQLYRRYHSEQRPLVLMQLKNQD
ncbi:GNAT family N-acetyltransferase [Shewanella sp. SG41-4]|uniref:GNAT family N-acetyltransferase n=1 Tax=Shewanella sp. SG41-4 TaxID=2760976 RepID=UPI001602FDC5|nr:GNAT family N-acetyltransferase [Shewanella sp. SG41-4]MBB1437374.1 GNAT family N-acetyltransferase [Shewanella sp. SG41-4]